MTLLISFRIRDSSPVFYELLLAFQSWTSDKKSFYFDPLLLSAINKLSHQMQRKLNKELKERSVKVVSLSMNKLIIDSNKKTFKSAVDYGQYVMDLFGTMELFRDIKFNEKPKFWRFLIFHSSQQYAGLEHGHVDYF